MSISTIPTLTTAGACDAAPALGLTFIFGAARSGTTWLAKLFDSNPEVLYVHEPFIKGQGLLYHQAVQAAGRGESLAVDRRELIREFIAYRDAFARPPFFAKQYRVLPSQLQAVVWYLKRLLRLNQLPSTSLAGPLHLVLKEGLTRASLPLARGLGSKAVLLFRHPCGVVNSRLRGQRCGAMKAIDRQQLWQDNAAAFGDLGFTAPEVLGMSDEELLALDWLITYQPVTQHWKDDPERARWISYEALVHSTQDTIEDLFRWCGLVLTRQTLDFLAISSQPGRRSVRTLLGQHAAYFGVDRRAQEPANAWQSELSSRSIERIMSVALRFPRDQWPPEIRPWLE